MCKWRINWLCSLFMVFFFCARAQLSLSLSPSLGANFVCLATFIHIDFSGQFFFLVPSTFPCLVWYIFLGNKPNRQSEAANKEEKMENEKPLSAKSWFCAHKKKSTYRVIFILCYALALCAMCVVSVIEKERQHISRTCEVEKKEEIVCRVVVPFRLNIVVVCVCVLFRLPLNIPHKHKYYVLSRER